jgi:hypothetical protein
MFGKSITDTLVLCLAKVSSGANPTKCTVLANGRFLKTPWFSDNSFTYFTQSNSSDSPEGTFTTRSKPQKVDVTA